MILVSVYGANKANLKATGFGEKNPIADNSKRAGRLTNRRVVIRLVD